MRFTPKNGYDENTAREIAEAYSLTPLVGRILAARGFTAETAMGYLNPCEEQIIPPFEFDAMGEVCERIEEAISCGERIAVYSDYDTDGICAAAIMFRLLKALGTTPIMYVPDRFTEGYGTNEKAIKELCKEASLIISVDCGIRSVDDVEAARKLGTDFIIADHHECGELPKTPFILDPKNPGGNYPFKELCGAGIAFKIAYAMTDDEELLSELIQYAAIATIADMVELKEENRAIASLGIMHMRKKPALGIRKLCEASGINYEKISSYDIGFMISPRINAAGRMASGRISLDLLITDDEERAQKSTESLCRLNAERQQLQGTVTEKCIEQIAEMRLCDKNILVVASDEFEEGVVGLAAGRIAEMFNRPAVVFKRSEGILIGSARSINGIDLYSVLESCQDLFIKFGGHEQAAGLSLKEENFSEFVKRADGFIAQSYSHDVFVKEERYDAWADASMLTMEDALGIEALEPFGEGNERPLLFFENTRIEAVRRMGKDDKHARFRANDAINMVCFGAPDIPQGSTADISGSLGINEYNGKKSLQVIAENIQINSCEKRAGSDFAVKSFLKEICVLYDIMQNPEKYHLIRTAEQFKQEVAQRFNDPIGAAVCVGADIGEQMFSLLKINGAEEFFAKIPRERSENAVIIAPEGENQLKNYSDVYLIGALDIASERKDAHILMNSGLFKAYKAKAQSFFVEKNELIKYYRAIAASEAGDSLSGMLKKTAAKNDLPFEKMWYAFNVFKEQKLIEVKKSDKIIFISNEKPQRRSLTKLAFETVLK